MMEYDKIEIANKSFYFRDGTSDSVIMQHTFFCKPEDREYNFPQGIPKVIFDIGANIGAISVLMANIYPNSIIYSFEPVEANFELLKRNTKKYGNIKIFNYGLGEKSSFFKMLTSKDPLNHGGHSLHDFGCDIEAKSEVVTIKNINEVIEDLGIEFIDLVKIDCEGAETEILKSLNIINKVGFILGELHCFRDYELLGYLSNYFHLEFKKGFHDANYQFRAIKREIS